MYQCQDCHQKTEHPAHRLQGDNPPSLVSFCPNCGSTNLERLAIRYCHGCGIRLTGEREEYCSALCQKRAERLFATQLQRAKYRQSHPLTVLCEQVEQYNAAHGTHYSYGQFVALVQPHLKGEIHESR